MIKSQTLRNITQETGVPLEWRVGDRIINTYEVKQVFDTGGMALVYRVRHLGWDIDLAVKSPRREVIEMEGSAENITQEAETWVNLGLYPHIVSCYYVRVLGKVPRLFMEYVDGGSLGDAIDQQRLYTGTPEEVLRRILDIAIQCAWGLHYAHERGLIHQDMKPPNVLLTRDGVAKVTDFGLAEAGAIMRKHEAALHPLENSSGDRSIRVDTLGMTPNYCSPEQAALQTLSRRTDLWSWAVSVMEMFIGKKTWGKGPFAMQGLEMYLKKGSDNPSIPRMPEKIVELLRQCFQFKPDERPRDMHLAAECLKAVYSEELGTPYPRQEPRIDTILADTLNNRAVSMVDLKRTGDAVRLLDQAIQAEPNHPAALYNRCLVLWREGRLADQEVVSILRENIRQQPENWYPFYLLGLVHLERGDVAEANRINEMGLNKFGDQPAFKNLAQLIQRMASNAGSCLRVIKANDSAINSVVTSRDGELVLAGGNDGTVCLWRVGTAEQLKMMTGHENLVHAVRFSPGEGFALSASWDHTLRLWHLASGTCVKILEGHEDLVQDVAFFPDGKRALSASADYTLRLWDLTDGACRAILTGHRDAVSGVAVSPDGRYAVSISYDNTIRRWDLERATCVGKIDWLRSSSSNLCMTPDGMTVLLAAGDNRIYQIDLITGQPVGSLAGHAGGTTAVAVAPNGAWVLSGGVDAAVKLWDLTSKRCLRTYTGHTATINSVAICPEKVLAVSGGNDQLIRVWRLGVGREAPYVTVQPRSSQEVMGLSAQLEQALNLAEERFSTGDYRGSLEILAKTRANPQYRRTGRLLTDWDKVGRKGIRDRVSSTWLVQSFRAHPERANSLAFSEDPRIGMTGGEEGLIVLWNLERGAAIRPIVGHHGPVNSVKLSTAQNRALSGGSDGTVRLWSLESGECLCEFKGHTSEVNSVALSFDGRLALSGSNDNTLRLWNLDQGTALKQLKGHTHYVRSVAFTPDGRLALSASWDKTVRVWDLASGECLRVMAGHNEVVDILAVSPDGRIVVSGGLERILRIWDVDSGVLVRTITDIPWRVTTVDFAPDGRALFCGSEDGSIDVWSVGEGKRLYSFKGHNQPVTGLAISSDGCLVATASGDHLLKVWRLDWEYLIPARDQGDQGLTALLMIFIQRNRPLGPDGIVRAGKPTWTDADLAGLMHELGYRGYGYLSEETIVRALKQLLRQVGS